MFDDDRSAAHGLMSAQRLIVFKHDSKLGNAPANKLFDLVNIEKKDPDKVARSFNDYKITVGQAPAGVTIQELI
jgi:CRISPR-associated protein Csd2